MASRAANLDVCFDIGATWLLIGDVRDDDGFPLDLSALTEDGLKLGVFSKTTPAILCKSFDLDEAELTLAPNAISAAPLTGSFLADNVVPAVGAGFDDLNIKLNDTVIIAGSTSNDGTYLAVANATDNDSLVVKNTDESAVVFTAEASLGTVTIENLARFQFRAEPPATYTLIPAGQYRYDVRYLQATIYDYALDGTWEVIQRSPAPPPP